MKRTRLALAACTLAGAVPALAQTSSVTIYGVMDLEARRVHAAGRGGNTLLGIGGSQAARLGFRGHEDLGGGLSAGFQIETALRPNNGTSGTTDASGTTFWDRLSFVRLRHTAVGELRLGFDYTPTYNVWSPADPFFQTGLGTNANVAPITTTNALGAPYGSTSRSLTTLSRSKNSVAYHLPAGRVGGLVGSVMVAGSEGSPVATTGKNSYRSARLGWVSGPIDVAVGYSTTRNDRTGDDKVREFVAHAIYDFGAAKVALATRQIDYRALSTDIHQASLWLDVGASGLVKGTVARGINKGSFGAVNNDGLAATQLSFGYEHSLSKRTVLYTTLSRIANSDRSTVSLPGANGPTTPGDASTGFGLGMRHNF